MRRNFAQILLEVKIDPQLEYQKLYGMLFERNIPVSNSNRISAYDELSECFINFSFRGTCLTLEEFNDLYGFHFEKEPTDFKIDDLVSLCEYMENLLIGYLNIPLGFPYGYGSIRPQIMLVSHSYCQCFLSSQKQQMNQKCSHQMRLLMKTHNEHLR